MVCYELGQAEYRAKNWQAALMHFKKAITIADDMPSKTLFDRCVALLERRLEVPELWDGTWKTFK
jgi:adenylate cyclase